MPDTLPMLWAMGLSAAVAALLLLACGWPWRSPAATRVNLGWLLGVGTASVLGCGVLGLRPRWPPREDLDRFLVILLPATMLVEILGALPTIPRRAIWLLRLLIAAAAARVLLHATTYLADLAGPGTREWNEVETWGVLMGLAAALAVEWALLDLLTRKAAGPAVPLALALCCAGAAVAVMLSGYFTGGQLGLPFAAALIGAALASLALSGPCCNSSAVGLGLVTLFSVLIIGRFFGKLTTLNAALLFLAPLLGFLPELPYVRKLRPALRGALGAAVVAIPIVVAVNQAHQKYQEEARKPATPGDYSVQDLTEFVPSD